MSLDVRPVQRPEWSPLPYEGCVGVDGRVLVREERFFVAMLRFGPHGTIHEHAGESDTAEADPAQALDGRLDDDGADGRAGPHGLPGRSAHGGSLCG